MLIVDKLKPFPKCDIGTDDKALAAWCRWWRDALGLQSWTLDVSYSRFYAMDNAYGRTTIKTCLKFAAIQLKPSLDAEDFDANFDIEQTLVHELLHIKLWHHGFNDTETIEGRLDEQVIDTLSWSFVNLRRSSRG
jgi:hypothetical protein